MLCLTITWQTVKAGRVGQRLVHVTILPHFLLTLASELGWEWGELFSAFTWWTVSFSLPSPFFWWTFRRWAFLRDTGTPGNVTWRYMWSYADQPVSATECDASFCCHYAVKHSNFVQKLRALRATLCRNPKLHCVRCHNRLLQHSWVILSSHTTGESRKRFQQFFSLNEREYCQTNWRGFTTG